MILDNPVPGTILPEHYRRTRENTPRLPNGRPAFRVTAGYNAPDLIHPGELHEALDLGNYYRGDPVLAAARGTGRRVTDPGGALGVAIDHGDGWRTEYWHLDAWAIPAGAVPVNAGARLGTVGSTGLGITGVHLHFELKRHGARKDPWPMLQQNRKQTFHDVPPEHPFYAPIEWMAAAGITAGTGSGDFSPDRQLTRAELAALLYRYDAWRRRG